MKRDNLHLMMLLIGLVFFIYLEYIGSDSSGLPLGIMVGLALQHYIDNYYAEKELNQRGKNDN